MNVLATSTPLQNGGANFGSGDVKNTSSKKPKGLIEQMYQKKTQLEHVLLRPDTYIGSVEAVTEEMWVYNEITSSMIQRKLTYVPGLYKIFDEILVNAADNKQRDSAMDCIKININATENVISIWNNGKGIPVVEHEDEKMYVPTMIFGHLLTSSNYNDEEQKVTGGRNGYGAKLCNIFSTKFTVETASKEYKRKFKQSWSNNMTNATQPIIKETFDDFTKITFSPDLKKFKMDSLDKDIVDLMSRRAYDVAASTKGVKVFLNDKRIPVKSFKDYIELFVKVKDDNIDNTDSPVKILYENVNPRWEVAVIPKEDGFQQMSFVNSIATTKGGRHVDYVVDIIIKYLAETLKKKNKGKLNVKPSQIKDHLWIFVNCLIVNPTFDSQTKENMTLQAKNFGSKCNLSDKFLQNVAKSRIIELVLSFAAFKAQAQLERTGGKKKSKIKGLAKLEDANDAGTKNSIYCTLILTEGDSAKTLVMSGLGVVGRDRYGVFPLRGKLLNVREASFKQVMENAEIKNIVQILGLNYKQQYNTVEDLKSLRYGKLMIMTDQDQDGSHIKGLIINFIHYKWPSLLRLPFLEEFITPIIKATFRKNVLSFFSIPEFEEWKSQTNDWNKYNIKYYKGLGTSTSSEAKDYFSNMERHRILFTYNNNDDDSHITMAFSKKMVEARKNWLSNWMAESKRRKEMGLPEEYLYTKNTRNVSYKDFINKELVLFSNMDNERSIPNLLDGLKPGSRKVIYTCLTRKMKAKGGEIKVTQLAGAVSEHSAYHHGETSLMTTIINLAQNFVGSNNINLLQPIGQFGSRVNGGKDYASPRYIFTKLSPLARLIFHKADEPLLSYLTDDNLKVEPMWYIPIIPMVLVNGAEGIGTGWMTKIPNHNPREIVDNLLRMLRGDEPLPMKPWYKNFTGVIEKIGESRYVTNGEVGILSDEKIEITELPIGTWTSHYKDVTLLSLSGGSEKSEKSDKTEKTPPLINDVKDDSTEATVKFTIFMNKDKLKKAEFEGLHKVFKLQTILTITSMCAFDQYNVLRKYDSTLDILKEFFKVRLEFYDKRKKYVEEKLGVEALVLSNKARFIVEKCEGKIKVENRKKKEMVAELERLKFDKDPMKAWKRRMNLENAEEEEPSTLTEEEDDQEEEAETEFASQSAVSKLKPLESDKDYDYLLGMTMWNLTLEYKNRLLQEKDLKFAELNELKKKFPSDLWKEDLKELLQKLDETEEKEREEALMDRKEVKKEKGLKKKGGKAFNVSVDTLPSKHAIRVEPKIDDDLIKKVEKAEAAKENKEKRLLGEAEDKDGQDGLISKKGAKKEKVPKKKGAKALNVLSDTSSSKDASKVEDDVIQKEEKVQPAKETRGKRVPKKIIKEDTDSESDEMDDFEAKIKKQKNDMSSDDIFDSLLKSPPKRITTKKPRAKYSFAFSDDSDDALFSSSGSSSDYEPTPKKSKGAAKKTKPAGKKIAGNQK